MSIILTLGFLVIVTRDVLSHDTNPVSDELIDLINSNQTLWTAGRNFDSDICTSYLKKLAGTIKSKTVFKDTEPPRWRSAITLPSHFDARDKWKNCSSISDIRDQGACGSCWAVSTVSAMGDRLCIQSAAREKIYFSEFDLMSCCMFCGGACNTGGLLREAWRYGVRKGIVSGGIYNSQNGCKPYTIAPCDHNTRYSGYRQPCGHDSPKTVCQRTCQPSFWKTYKRDRRKLAKFYQLTDVRGVMADIYEHGPVTTVFEVREDFFNYKSGVYRNVAGEVVGHHSVKIIGWGEVQGVPYWLAANSWNTDWGDGGFFKIIRGVNHLGIEDKMYAGLFRV